MNQAIIIAVIEIAFMIAIARSGREMKKCTECGGTLYDWNDFKLRCRQDGNPSIKHKIY